MKFYLNTVRLRVKALKFLISNENLFENSMPKEKSAKNFNLQYIIDGSVYKFIIYNV